MSNHEQETIIDRDHDQISRKNRRLFTGLLVLWLAAIIFASQTSGIWEWGGLISMLAISVPMGIMLTYERYPL